MRYIVVAVIAALILSTPCHAEERPLSEHSCGKYLAAVHGHAPGTARGFDHPQHGPYYDNHTRYMDWLDGFFSATNMWVTEEPNGIKSDNAAIDVWLRKWCDKNPTKPLHEAAMVFMLDQRKDYLKAWFAKQTK